MSWPTNEAGIRPQRRRLDQLPTHWRAPPAQAYLASGRFRAHVPWEKFCVQPAPTRSCRGLSDSGMCLALLEAASSLAKCAGGARLDQLPAGGKSTLVGRDSERGYFGYQE